MRTTFDFKVYVPFPCVHVQVRFKALVEFRSCCFSFFKLSAGHARGPAVVVVVIVMVVVAAAAAITETIAIPTIEELIAKMEVIEALMAIAPPVATATAITTKATITIATVVINNHNSNGIGSSNGGCNNNSNSNENTSASTVNR